MKQKYILKDRSREEKKRGWNDYPDEVEIEEANQYFANKTAEPKEQVYVKNTSFIGVYRASYRGDMPIWVSDAFKDFPDEVVIEPPLPDSYKDQGIIIKKPDHKNYYDSIWRIPKSFFEYLYGLKL